MSIIDFPPFNKDVPPLGTFVVVALDPAASLAVLDDEKVEVAANRVKTRKRLVMVDFVLGGDLGATYYRYHPIGSGLPRDPRESVPVEPVSAHPEGRFPISCSKRLPIENPYVHTTETFEGEVSRIYMGQPSDIHCSAGDRRRAGRHYMDYMMRNSASVSLCPVYEPREGGADDSVPATEPQCFTVLNPWEGCPETFMEPKYQMWLHVNEDESYADPNTLRDEIAELCAIETEWRERREAEIKAKIEQLQAWREGVDLPRDTEKQEGRYPGGLVHGNAPGLPEDVVGEDLAGEEELATFYHIDTRDDPSSPYWESVRPCDEYQPQRAESTLRALAAKPSSTDPATESLRSSSGVSSWMTSARAWVKEAVFFKARLFRGFFSLVPGEHW